METMFASLASRVFALFTTPFVWPDLPGAIPEFRERSVTIFRKALHGLCSSSWAFFAHFADFLNSMGFVASQYDRDVWMREREIQDGYNYLCTHVNDFKIVVAKQPN